VAVASVAAGVRNRTLDDSGALAHYDAVISNIDIRDRHRRARRPEGRVVKSLVISAGAVALGAALAAQTPPPSAAVPARLDVAGQMQSQYGLVKSNLTKLADKMPDDGYAFKPASEMRTFLQSVAHTAAANFGMCANLTGKPNPRAGVDLEKTLSTKADAVQALRDSFVFCDEYMTHLSAETLGGAYRGMAIRGSERTPLEIERGGLASNLIAHNNEMYGYLAVYLRLKGLVPPSSEGRAGRGGTY
jgi:hypothetical protein